MNIIGMTVHGVLDYLMGALLLVWPWVADFQTAPAATASMMGVGGAIILYSLLTDYPVGRIRVLPVGANLVLDCIVALFLIVSPYLFGFSNYVSWPHVFFGGALLVMVLVSPFQLVYRQPERSGTLTGA